MSTATLAKPHITKSSHTIERWEFNPALFAKDLLRRGFAPGSLETVEMLRLMGKQTFFKRLGVAYAYEDWCTFAGHTSQIGSAYTNANDMHKSLLPFDYVINFLSLVTPEDFEDHEYLVLMHKPLIFEGTGKNFLMGVSMRTAPVNLMNVIFLHYKLLDLDRTLAEAFGPGASLHSAASIYRTKAVFLK